MVSTHHQVGLPPIQEIRITVCLGRRIFEVIRLGMGVYLFQVPSSIIVMIIVWGIYRLAGAKGFCIGPMLVNHAS